MTLILIVVLAAVFASATLIARRISIRRHRIANRRAAEPVLIDDETIDAAELIWSVRQASDAPTLYAINSLSSRSAGDVVDLVSKTVDALPPDRRLDLVTTRVRLQQTRHARETLTQTADSLAATAGPAVADALLLVLGQAVGASILADTASAFATNALETLLPHKPAVGLVAGHVPGAEHALEAVASTVGDGVGNAIGAVVDAHIPVVTIVMSLHRANRSRRNGLEAARVTENLAWDVGARGGSIVGGAAIGTAFFPGPGTIIGGLIGAALGSGAAHHGKNRHIAAARRKILASVEELGAEVAQDTLHQLLTESEHMLATKKRHRQRVVHEAAHLDDSLTWRQRVFHPTVARKITDRVVAIAAADIEYDENLHAALKRTIGRSSRSASARAYLWTAGSRLFAWRTFVGPDTSRLTADIDSLEAEHNKLSLAR